MRALVFDPPSPRLVADRPRPDRPGEATVRVLRAGVCATDLEIVKGYMDFRGVLGHEWVGVVDAAPDPAWVGLRVVGEINAACGRCPTCLAGTRAHCPHRTVLGIAGRDGAFAESLSLPIENLHAVPDAVTDEQAAFVEPLAAACEVLQQVHLRPTDRVAVMGAGRLGQLCARVLALTGAEVSVVSRSRGRLERLPQGVTGVLAADAGSLPPQDVVVECTGSADGLAGAVARVRPRGTVVLKTTVAAAHAVHLAPLVIHEVTVVGSRCGPFAAALRLLERGLVDPTPLVDARFPLSQGLAALRRAAEPGVLKVLIDPAA